MTEKENNMDLLQLIMNLKGIQKDVLRKNYNSDKTLQALQVLLSEIDDGKEFAILREQVFSLQLFVEDKYRLNFQMTILLIDLGAN